MKVVFLARRYFPSVGGVERHIQGVIQALYQLRPDLEVVIVTEQHDQQLSEHEVVDGVDVFRIPLDQKTDIKSQIWSWISQHRSVVHSSDIVHIHDVFFWMIPDLLVLSRPQMYMTFHGYEPPGPPNWKQKFWHQMAEMLTQGSIAVGGFHQKWYGVEPSIPVPRSR
jgi:glycosyltransferase involved in cell wall biosynthesis